MPAGDGEIKMVNIGNEWDALLADQWDMPYYKKLREFLVGEYRTKHIYPDMNDIFNALKFTPMRDVKVVLLGQDPYHERGQAHGLCFSVKKGVPKPPSLENMMKELKRDLGYDIPRSGELTSWAKQGVLMMNTVLTVREGQADSHRDMGWEIFTDHVIKLLSDREDPVIFLLWGAKAQKKASIITNPKHVILTTSHPSPLSVYRGFDGCGHFGQVNRILKDMGKEPIDWRISD